MRPGSADGSNIQTAATTTPSVDPDSLLLRVYAIDELRADGYPFAWREINDHVVQQAGARCVRCGHPYRKGQHGKGEWSPCDERCTHRGPIRNALLIEVPCPNSVGTYFEHGNVGIQAKWRILTVHHLNGIKADCRWWNLAALCQRCHLTIQGRVRMEQLFPFEHSEWFKPYAAGYYAHAYLGEDITRDEASERMDELLALERVV